ncbi:MAG: quinol:electron acceptor oxidoreductase subunit ActD [Verrucomicrobiales bacterium]
MFASKQFHRTTDDAFFIAIEARDPKFSPEATKSLLEDIGGANIELVEEEG